jgi:Tol biopolymer transport system component
VTPRTFISRSRLPGAITLALAFASFLALPGQAAETPFTFLVSGATGRPSNGTSANPSVSNDGTLVVFDTAASNLGPADPNGSTRDVYARASETGTVGLISASPSKQGANGPSTEPAVSGDGKTIAFTSQASNLGPADVNGVSDVYVRHPDGTLEVVSVSARGSQANGASSQPSISSDGRYVAFTSDASNLVLGDTNGATDVFVRDLKTKTTVRASVRGASGDANGNSAEPAISANGRVVSFSSDATNLVARDTNRVSDVFVRVLPSHRTERVSVSSRERQQNLASLLGFAQLSAISADGRYVAFDSDATNLVARDRNRDTDVFVRDRRAGNTRRVSVSTTGAEGDNDSFAPSISADGKLIAFESFAENLSKDDAEREDVFVRDLHTNSTITGTITYKDRARGPELVNQLLQRPALSGDGRLLAFASSAAQVTAGDTNGRTDVFARLIAPQPGTYFVVPIPQPVSFGMVQAVGSTDPKASRVLCRFDGKSDLCIFPYFPMPHLKNGRHRLTVGTARPGRLFDSGATQTFNYDGVGPSVRIISPKRGQRRRFSVISGTGNDHGGVGLLGVRITVQYYDGHRCRTFFKRGWRVRPCGGEKYGIVVLAKGNRWSLRVPARRGVFGIYVAGADKGGNAGGVTVRNVTVK